MARGSKIGYKRNTRNKVQLRKKGSDESDEDYMVSEDEVFDLSEDEYCSSLADDESEEEEEEEWFEKKPKKAGKTRGQKGFPGRKKNGVMRPRRKMVSYNEDEEDCEDEGFIAIKESTNNVSSRNEKDDDDDDDDEEDLFEPEEEEEEEYEDDSFMPVKESKKNVLLCKENVNADLFEPEEEEEEDYEDDSFISVKESKKNVLSRKENENYEDEDLFEQEKDDEEEDYEDEDFVPINESKKNVISHKVKEDDDNEDLFEQEEDEEEKDDDFITVKESKKIVTSRENNEDLFEQEENDFCNRKSKISRTRYGNGFEEKPRKKNRVSYREAGEDSDSDDSEDSDDEEFTPDEIDGLEDEVEETPVIKNRMSRPRMQMTRFTKGRRTKRNRRIMNITKRRNTAKEQSLSKKRKSIHDNECNDDKHLSWKKTKNTKQGTRRKKLTINSDSDFVSSGPSDHEFTISEEEREQVREASEFCKRLRSSDPPDLVIEKETVLPERKRSVRKGKEKMVELKIELGKQVCGICLSEEGKRTVRGILNSCTHYFCFACIMEWSKVETRCPLCKQRFATITRTSRADGGLDSRDAVIAVPERDQVYQPSEEELRGYLDPYESVLCTECQQGGDDAHMLLCDLCDSPAHTYCVGLGQEVPDGNWYCDGCRPTVLASQAQTPATDHRAGNNSFASSSPPIARETLDLNEMYVPETPLTQVSEPSPLFRNPNGDSFATSPTYGSGAFTLFERRRIQRQIHQFLNARSRRSERSDVRNPQTAFAPNDMASVSSTTLFGSQIVSITPHNAVVPVRAAPEGFFDQGRLLDYGTPLMYSREGISPRFRSLRGQMPHDEGSTSISRGFVELPQNHFSGIEERIGGVHQQLQPCSGRSNAGVGANISPFQFREATVPSRTYQRSPHPPF